METSIQPMPTLPQSDHDLLIRVDTTLTHMRDDFKALTDTTKSEVAELQVTKLSRLEFDQWKKDAFIPLEGTVATVGKQADRNSRFIWLATGGLIVAQLVIQLVFAIKEHLIF
jgi:hypothetical protein